MPYRSFSSTAVATGVAGALLLRCCVNASATATRGCALLPAGGSGEAQQCVRFDSFSAGLDSAFTCAPLSEDAIRRDDWTVGLRPVGERRCSDWDGAATDAGCASLEPLAWRDVAFFVLATSVDRLRDLERWYVGEVTKAPLLVLEATAAGVNDTDLARWAALHSQMRYKTVISSPSSTTSALDVLAIRRAGVLASWVTHPYARFHVWLRDDVRVFPEHLLSVLCTAEDAFGVAQAYELGSAEDALPWQALYGFGFGAGGGAASFSGPAARTLAEFFANHSDTECTAAAEAHIAHTTPDEVADAIFTCALRRAGIITVHCGHFVTRGAAYAKRNPEGNTSVQHSIWPLPGNPAAVQGASHLPVGVQLCLLPGSLGDPFCALAHPALARLEAAAVASGARSDAVEVHAVLSHFNEPHDKVNEHITLLRTAIPALKRVFVYSKGASPFPNATVLPNIGRESHTYLHHIVQQYHSLPSHLIFVQAVPNLYDVYKKRLALFTNRTGLLNLGGADTSTCEGSDAYKMVRLREIYVLTHRAFCPREPFISFLNGQFAVSRHRVLSNPLHVYKYLTDMMDAPPSHFLHADIEDVWPSLQQSMRDKAASNNANYLVFVLERAWTVLFRCRIAPRAFACCSAPDAACAAGDCQCEDD